ncbi:MAG: dienelactone hydrolase [Betaproteobacteria bacterium]
MRKDLPVLVKYLLVVATAFALAMFIAQNDAAAQAAPDSGARASPAPAITAMPYGARGAFSVKTSDATWHDDARKREVPVRIYSPVPEDSKSVSGNGAASYPVILFSHGLGGNRLGGKLWAEQWASHGYVVVAMQHAGSDESLWKDRPLAGRVAGMKAGMTLSNLGLRVNDVRFVIDEINRRTAAKESAFAGADPKRLGMSGHSFGAQTTLAVSGQKAGSIGGQAGLDTRIVSSIAFSPNARNKANVAKQFGDIRIPFFSITGTKDGSILDDGTRYEDRMMPYENMPAGGKYLAVFEDGDHMVFGGHELGARRAATARDAVIQSGVKAITTAFWDATLKNDAPAKKWLDGGGAKAALAFADVFSSK